MLMSITGMVTLLTKFADHYVNFYGLRNDLLSVAFALNSIKARIHWMKEHAPKDYLSFFKLDQELTQKDVKYESKESNQKKNSL